MLFFSVIANAAPGINKTISFQGRLLSSAGTPVPDGFYNIQFKIYEGGTGTAVGNPGGTLKWTETYTNNGASTGVKITNGYMSVNLGSQTAFGTSVDWNQDTLWLSMNIAGLTTGCSTFNTGNCLADGEMVPMKRLTATPYALNAGMVGGKTADELIHNGTTQQTGNFNISGTGRANILQGNTSIITPLIASDATGLLTLGSSTTYNVNIATSNNVDQVVHIGTGNGKKQVTVGSTDGESSLQLQGGTGGVAIGTNGYFYVTNAALGTIPFNIAPDGSSNFQLGVDSTFSITNSDSQPLLSIGHSGTVSVSGEITTGGNVTAGGDVTTKGDLKVLSPDETESAGITWYGGNSVATVGTTSDTLALQGGGVNLLTAKNDGGQARVGIGNAATSEYALDVTGGVNASEGYAINGASILSSSSVNFGGNTTSSVNAASGQILQLSSDTGVRIGNGQETSEPTLFALDRATGNGNLEGDAILGSMYYDTTLGKIQCYEADGWGNCSSSPDRFVSLNPEYTNTVTNGTGIGTMTSDICSDSLNINDGSSAQPAICSTNETYNYYNWTSAELTPQTKSMYVTYQLPENFDRFVDGSTSLIGRIDNTNASVSYEVYKNTETGLVLCGELQDVASGTQTAWNKAAAEGNADPATCDFAPGQSVIFKINLTASNGANAYVSTLGFAFKDN